MKVILPLEGKWYVVRGGYDEKDSHSWEMISQRYAFDLVKLSGNGKIYRENLCLNENYYSFGQKVISPCNGEVIDLYSHLKDNEPFTIRKISYFFPLGNFVTIKYDNNTYVTLAHLKENSISVRKGEKVKAKDVIGCVGNSGHSSYPHLHFQIQNKKRIFFSKGLPIYFFNTVIYFNNVPICSERIYKNMIVESY